MRDWKAFRDFGDKKLCRIEWTRTIPIVSTVDQIAVGRTLMLLCISDQICLGCVGDFSDVCEYVSV